jgi:hypothetical protein
MSPAMDVGRMGWYRDGSYVGSVGGVGYGGGWSYEERVCCWNWDWRRDWRLVSGAKEDRGRGWGWRALDMPSSSVL